MLSVLHRWNLFFGLFSGNLAVMISGLLAFPAAVIADEYIIGSMSINGDTLPHGYLATKTNLGIPDLSYDAAGGADPVVFRPSSGQWYIDGSGVDASQQWGLPGDIPIRATFTADPAAAPVTAWRPSTGVWYTKGRPAVQFGLKGDIPWLRISTATASLIRRFTART